MEYKSNKRVLRSFILGGFFATFILATIGITIEDAWHKIPLLFALSKWHHFVTPFFLGLIGAALGFYFWRLKQKQEQMHFNLLSVEEKFISYINLAGDAIYLHDLNGRIIEFNKQAVKGLGYSYQEFKNLRIFDIDLLHTNIQSYKKKLKQLKYGETLTIETVHRRKDGSTFPVEIKVSKVSINNNSNYLSIGRDISERKKAEHELSVSNNKFQTLYEYAPLAYQSLDISGKVLDINPAWTDSFGYKREEVIGKHFSYFMTPDSKHLMKEVFKQFMETGKVKNAEFSIIHKNKTVLQVTVNGKLSYHENESIKHTHCILTDITLQKNFEQELKQSEERFKMLSNFTFEGLLVHKNGVVKEFNKSVEKILGYTLNELKGKNILDTFVHPINKHELSNYLDWNYAPPYEILGIHNDGSEIALEIESKDIIYKGETQKAMAIRDISKRRDAQDSLKQFYTAVEQSANSIIITNIDGNIQYANNKFYSISGYTAEEIIDKNPRIVKSGMHKDEFYKKMWEAISSGYVWTGEICNKRKNGELFWESATITPVYDNAKKISSYIAIKEDITEKKHTEKRLLNAIIDTEEKERKRFAEDLHDELGPFLSGINLYINELSYEDVNYEKRLSIINYLKHFTNEAVAKTRTISHQLMPSMLSDYGLKVALESFCNKLSLTGQITIELDISLEDKIENEVVQVVVYRIAIELINNTLKHANATAICIAIHKFKNELEFTYTDNGKGFDLKNSLKLGKGLGLQNIINRIESLNGEYTFGKLADDKGIEFKFLISLG